MTADEVLDEPHTPCRDDSCSQDREKKMVTLERAENGLATVWCDPCIAPLVSVLNTAGFKTVASCCGHGRRPAIISLRDGSELIVARSYAEARKIEALFPGTINDSMENKPDGEKAKLISGYRELLAKCSRNGYTTWDKSMVPLIDGKYEEEATKKWEAEHGHDIRLKCYPEFGCQLWLDPEDLLEGINKALGVSE